MPRSLLWPARANVGVGWNDAAVNTNENWAPGRGGYLVLPACRWLHSGWIGNRIWPTCVLSIWVSPKVLVHDLCEVPRVLADERETPGIVSSILGSIVIGRAGKPRAGAVLVCKLLSIHLPLCQSEMDGLTVVLMTNRPDEKKTSRNPVRFSEHLFR